MNYVLDFEGKVEVKLSNDAFYFLRDDEPPIDDSCMDEVNSIYEIFENGFIFEDSYKFIDNGLVLATIVPYVEDSFDYDLYFEVAKETEYQIKYLSETKVLARYYNSTKRAYFEEELDIKINKFGKPEIHTRRGSIYPLWKAKKKGEL